MKMAMNRNGDVAVVARESIVAQASCLHGGGGGTICSRVVRMFRLAMDTLVQAGVAPTSHLNGDVAPAIRLRIVRMLQLPVRATVQARYLRYVGGFAVLSLFSISSMAQVKLPLKPNVTLLALKKMPERFVLKGAVVHTVSGATFSPGEVLVEKGKILAVGKSVESGSAQVIDVAGLHLYPGLISAAANIGLVEVSAVRSTRDMSEVGAYTPDVRSWLAVNPDSELIPVARAGGITHSLVVPSGGTISGQSGVIQLTGWGMEEMAVEKPVALHVWWPSMRLRLAPKHKLNEPKNWKSPEVQDKDRKKRLNELIEFFDDARAYSKAKAAAANDKSIRFLSVPAWEAMIPYVAGSKPVMVHADDARQIRAAVDWSRTNQFKMILCGGEEAWKTAALLASNNVPVIYEHVFALPADDVDAYDQPFKNPELLRKAGVKVAISVGMGRFGASSLRDLPHAAGHARAFGLAENEAVKTITLNPAQILGIGKRLGSIEQGKDATLIAVNGSILDVRASVQRMWIAGEEVGLASRHTRLYEKYQQRPRR